MSGDEVADAVGKTLRRRTAHFEPEAAQNPAQAHLDIVQLRLHQLARGQDGTHLLRGERLAMHRAEPAEPHQLGNPACVVAVRLHRHRLESAAFTCRVSKSSTARPALRSPLCSHCDNGPASSPAIAAAPARQTRRSTPPARSQSCPPEQSCRQRPQHTRSSIPMTRRFLHNGPWSSLDDAWSGHVPTPLLDTISLRDDRRSRHQAASERATYSAVASERLATIALGPLPHLLATCQRAAPTWCRSRRNSRPPRRPWRAATRCFPPCSSAGSDFRPGRRRSGCREGAATA